MRGGSWALALLLLVGCGDEAPEGTATPPTGTTSPVEGPFEEGDWTATYGGQVANTCGALRDDEVTPAQFAILNTGADTFEVEFTVVGTVLGCTLAADDTYACDDGVFVTPGTDFEITLTEVTTGERIDRETLKVQYALDLECTGTGCDLAAIIAGVDAFPCNHTWYADAVFSG